jgi:hydrogenase-4 membrane subunit HyfE
MWSAGRIAGILVTVVVALTAGWWMHDSQWIGVGILVVFIYPLLLGVIFFADYVARALARSRRLVREAERGKIGV